MMLTPSEQSCRRDLSRPGPLHNGTIRMRARLVFLASTVALSLVASCSLHNPPPARNASAASNNRNVTAAPSRNDASDAGFASRARLAEHFEKHGREFGSISEDQYLRMAQELRDKPLDDSVKEAARGDGVVTRFDRNSGAFLAFNRDRTIRTFFKPNDGESYFRRQLNRRD